MQGNIGSTQARKKVQDKNALIHAQRLMLYASMDQNQPKSEVATSDVVPTPIMDSKHAKKPQIIIHEKI